MAFSIPPRCTRAACVSHPSRSTFDGTHETGGCSSPATSSDAAPTGSRWGLKCDASTDASWAKPRSTRSRCRHRSRRSFGRASRWVSCARITRRSYPSRPSASPRSRSRFESSGPNIGPRGSGTSIGAALVRAHRPATKSCRLGSTSTRVATGRPLPAWTSDPRCAMASDTPS